MNIVLSRTLPDDTLSRFRVYDMRPDETIEVSCDNVAEFNTARRNADQARKVYERTDGYQYKVESDTSRNIIKVSLYKEGKEDNGE